MYLAVVSRNMLVYYTVTHKMCGIQLFQTVKNLAFFVAALPQCEKTSPEQNRPYIFRTIQGIKASAEP
jgi:hypothetical protein